MSLFEWKPNTSSVKCIVPRNEKQKLKAPKTRNSKQENITSSTFKITSKKLYSALMRLLCKKMVKICSGLWDSGCQNTNEDDGLLSTKE